jgi:serine/threonine-protein kinase RsbW
MCSETRARCEPDTEQPLVHLRVCLAGDRGAISPVVESLMEALRAFPCAAAADFAIETALREALANAVDHGCRNDAAQLVECTVTCNPCGEVHIVVRDPGPGFDPASVPDPLSGERVRSNHGRGIYLIGRLMDRVWFERAGTEIHMALEPRLVGASADAPPFPQPLLEGMVHTC